MTVKLLTEHYLEFLSLKLGCTGLSESTCQNTTLLEITCPGSYKYGMYDVEFDGGTCDIGTPFLVIFCLIMPHDNFQACKVFVDILRKLG